jgi:hypothetical protein
MRYFYQNRDAVHGVTAILNNQPPRVRRSNRVIPGTFFALT